jgi:hypothetical protein
MKNPDKLTWDKSIYPRAARSQQTVSAYVEALDISAQFPPIKIQRVFNYTDEHGNEKCEATIILDGIIRLSRLGWTQEKISNILGVSQSRTSEIIGNTSFGNIDNLLSQGRDMKYIAGHYHMDLALAWALRLQGKTDQEKFKELGWGLRTWDQWNFNECLPREIHVNDKQSVFHWGDERFGDDWPGRIPAQLVAPHTLLFYKTRRPYP